MDIFNVRMTAIEFEIFIDETIDNMKEYKIIPKNNNVNKDIDIVSNILNTNNIEIIFEKDDGFIYSVKNSGNQKSIRVKNVSFASTLMFLSLLSRSYFLRKSKCFCKISDILTEMNNQSNIGFNIIKSNDLWEFKARIYS